MHLSVKHAQPFAEEDVPLNPDQSPADIVALSFTDSDLACMAAACRAEGEAIPTLRLTGLARLKHPLSVDLYVAQVAGHAKAIVVRLLGGYEWWRYGADELGRIARENNIALVMVPGDGRADARLQALSTAPPALVAAVDACLAQGGIENARRVLRCMGALARGVSPQEPLAEPVSAGALYRAVKPQGQALGAATVIFYRACHLAADTAPVDTLLEALCQGGMAARAFMVTSLKDPAALAALRLDARLHPPDIILDATAFSAGGGGDAHPLAASGVMILQCAMATASHAAWEESRRGLSTTDLAMHVVLPEADGRIFTRAISFKAESGTDERLEFTRMMHCPQPDRIAYVAALAAAWASLRKKAAAEKRLALVLSDYPGRAGRCAYAVGLDAPQSACAILRLVAGRGYDVGNAPQSGGELLAALQDSHQSYRLADYRKRFALLPLAQQQAVAGAWGRPEDDGLFMEGAFRLPCVTSGKVTIALQPDRGSRADRKTGYHDAAMPPRHGYLAFYWWLRDTAGIDALIHLGTHGNLEWLPGKSVALSEACWPEIALGPVPVIYPYLVSDPGEAAQAKRRIAAVTLGHLTPPLLPVALSPELAALETLVDEYGSADGLDGRRLKLLREEIIHRARGCGLPGEDDNALMTSLEAHLCDIKEQRVGDGLHVFGQLPEPQRLAVMAEALAEAAGGNADKEMIEARLAASAAGEEAGLLAALAGTFVMPGAGGSPVRGRLDVLPTGRNLVTVDPRTIPTPTAAAIGKRAAEEFVRRYMQDHGDWPRHVMIDLWGSATLRTGGDEIAQALWLMGVCPDWDGASSRVTGFTIVPAAAMAWPRIDVSLRISGLFRDMFAELIVLFDDAVKAVAGLDEEAQANPLAASVRGLDGVAWREATWRIFGSAPGAYGYGVSSLIDNGSWTHRDELGQAYRAASHFAYGRHADGDAQPDALKARIAATDALIHVQDQRETDVLSGTDFADAEGGFAAAASALGNTPALYHLDTSRPGAVRARTLAEELSLTLQARALRPLWIEGQMRHGYAGAAALADVVDQLFSFAAATDAVAPAQFDAVFDAYLYDDKVRDFLAQANPDALRAMAARFDEVMRRGLWNPRRNSVRVLLDTVRNGLPQEEAA